VLHRVAARLGYSTPGDCVDALGADAVGKLIALAELDGWGEEATLLARLVADNRKDCDWRVFLPGWHDEVK
jgi:hypothetical protein